MDWRLFKYNIEGKYHAFLENWQYKHKRKGYIVKIGILSSILFIAVLLPFLFRDTNSRPKKFIDAPPPAKAWFYDLKTGKLFADSAEKVPPITAPSGNLADGSLAGVGAVVLDYDSSDKNAKKIAYLEMYSSVAKEVMEKLKTGAEPTQEDVRLIEENHFIASPSELVWYKARSGQAKSLVCKTIESDRQHRIPDIDSPE